MSQESRRRNRRRHANRTGQRVVAERAAEALREARLALKEHERQCEIDFLRDWYLTECDDRKYAHAKLEWLRSLRDLLYIGASPVEIASYWHQAQEDIRPAGLTDKVWAWISENERQRALEDAFEAGMCAPWLDEWLEELQAKEAA